MERNVSDSKYFSFCVRCVVINPRRTCTRVRVVILCVCVSVSVCLYVENEVTLGSLWHFFNFYRVPFVENASFKSYGITCSPPQPFLLPDKFLMSRRDSIASFQEHWCVGFATDSSVIVLK